LAVQFDFDNQVVLVTGGATGLGFAIATAFGRAGARVALNDRSAERASEACERLAALGIDCRPFAADVRDGRAVASMVDEIEQQLGPIGIGVANAGVYPVSGFLDLTEEEWDRVIDTNLKGAFLTCQAVARRMVRGGRPGTLITLGSGAANHAIWGWSHYCASKAGVVLLTKTMALELAEYKIRANAVLPGFIDVDEGGAPLSEEYKERARAGIPLGPGKPEDIANAVVLLASPLAGFVTGTTLVVDGGSSAGKVGLRPVED
jgi:NAD(P)-dependent dehydrogenase (short-subunit alcohol dehydrogenase family)